MWLKHTITVLYLESLNVQNHPFKISASVIFLKYSWEVRNYSRDIFIKHIRIEECK